MNRDTIKQSAAMIEELEKVERDLADLNRDDIVVQVALHDKANGFTRIADVQRAELLAVLNGKRDALVKELERRGVDLRGASARADDLVKSIPTMPPPLPAGMRG